MRHLIAIAGLLALAGCASPITLLSPGTAGNPNDFPYAGSVGSAYDQGANPPATQGSVAYNPAPLPPPSVIAPPPPGAAAPGASLPMPTPAR